MFVILLLAGITKFVVIVIRRVFFCVNLVLLDAITPYIYDFVISL